MKLRTYRAMANLTQFELAEKLGVSELSVIKYEGGTTIPSKEALLKIYALTGGLVSPNDFFDLDAVDANSQLVEPGSTFVAAGLMSGTSMDGIDATLLLTDGERFIKEIGAHSIVYDPKFKLLIKGCERAAWQCNGDLVQARRQYPQALQSYLCQSQSISAPDAERLFEELCLWFHGHRRPVEFDQVIERSTDLHLMVVQHLLEATGYKAKSVDVIGYHGQTLFHRPAERITIQAGDGQRLADLSRVSVAYDFRSNDVKHGGQGAPFAPLYHKALATQIGLTPVVIANCGGISNITVIGASDIELCAFDCGPGNALIDRFVQQKIGKPMDTDGVYGSGGKVIDEVLAVLREKAIRSKDGSSYLDRPPPKSLDINDMTLIDEVLQLSLQDGCATLEAFTADCIVSSLDEIHTAIPKLWILAGGGWKNKVITRELEQRLRAKLGPELRVQHADQVGWSGQSMEAQIFAYLAVRCLRSLPLSVPGTTGVPEPLTGGQIALPDRDPHKASRGVRSLLHA